MNRDPTCNQNGRQGLESLELPPTTNQKESNTAVQFSMKNLLEEKNLKVYHALGFFFVVQSPIL